MPAGLGTPTLFLVVGLVLFLNATSHFAHRRATTTAQRAGVSAAGPKSDFRLPAGPEGAFGEVAARWPVAASWGGADGQSECDRIHLQPDRCRFVRENCGGTVTGMFNYLEFHYCSAAGGVLTFIALVCWLFLLFALVGIAASEFFCPNLNAIARSLRISENMAGVTFLAFGNGSPDLFSTFTALSAESGGLALGELVGAASFILNVVIGAMAVISPFEVTAYPFFRDLLFFVGAVSFVVCTVRDQRITLIEGIFLISYYLLYVTVVVAGDWLRRRRSKRRSLLGVSDAEPTVSSTHDDEHNQYGGGAVDDYAERQALLGKTPASAHPRPLRLPSTADEVGPSLMVRRNIQHRQRKSFLGAFEFRDAVQFWKQCGSRSTAFPAIDGFSPVLPRTPWRHRRERSSASFDPTRGRVVERPVFFRCSTYGGRSSPNQLASASGYRTISGGGSPPQKSPLRNETERSLREAGRRETEAAHPESRSRTTPALAPVSVPSIVVTPVVRGDSSFGPIDAPGLPHEPRSPGFPVGGCTQAEAPGREATTPSPPPVLQTQSVPEGNIVTTDHFPGVTPIEEQVAGSPSARVPAAAAARNALFPHLAGWRYRSLPSKIAGLVATPLVFLLIITVPVVGEDEEGETTPKIGSDLERERGLSGRTTGNPGTDVTVIDAGDVPRELYALKWNRWLTVVQFAAAPLFVSFALFAANPSFPATLVPVGIIAGAACGTLCYASTSTRAVPTWRRYLCFVGFAVAVVWIYFVADEVVSLLQSFGLILGVSDAIVGLTVFAMGNSLGDFVANVTIARMGFPVMAISACFGGPLLNILLGIGLSSTYLTASTGTTYWLSDMSPSIFVSSFMLLASLLSSLIIVPMMDYRLTRSYGYYLISLYVTGMIMNVSIEIYLGK